MAIYLFLITIVLAAFLHYLIQKIFLHYKTFDNINYRSSHKTLATRSGGIGIFLSLFIISLIHYSQKIELFEYSFFIPIGIMFVVGFYDDIYNANFKLKFLLQILVAKILIDQGFIITNYYGLFGINEVPWILAQLTTVFVFVVIVNAINFIDGIDGLAISEVIKVILLIEFFSEGFTNISKFGFMIIASLLPLYYFNFKNKKKIFLGDSGSLLLGTVVSIYIFFVLGGDFIFSYDKKLNKTLFVIMIISYPLIDLLRVFIIRLLKGQSPFMPDQNHIHHYLIRKFNSIKTIIIIQAIQIILFFIIAKQSINSLS